MMKGMLKQSLLSAAVVAILTPSMANATNGYFKIGYGAKNTGMAGTGLAFAQDSLAPAVNPASLTSVADRADAGLELFMPKRRGEVDATGIGGARSNEQSRSNRFLIPSLGISKKLSDRVTIGLSAVANGGLNTRYGNADTGNGNIFTDAFAPAIGGFVPLAIGGLVQQGVPQDQATAIVNNNVAQLASNKNNTPALGVNLAQALLTPTIAFRINEHHAVGFSPVMALQTFRAYGLGLFQAFSSKPDKVTNNGNDQAFGLGGRIGYQATYGRFSFGAAATSKVYMEEFNDYAGLFAEQGDFDIPATFGGGIAVKVTPKFTVAADISRILYGDVNSLANEGPTADEFFAAFGNALANPNPKPGSFLNKGLGKNNGFGFGWDDTTVYKIGLNYEYNPKWTLRAGYNYAEVPYDDDQALFNVLAPAVVEHHATAGFTWSPSTASEVTFSYMHAFNNDLDYTYKGTGNFAGFSYKARNKMYQNAVQLSYGLKF